MQVITEAELLSRIDTFLDRHDMAPTTFGRKATGEPQLIDSIRKGRSPSLKVVNRVIEFMDRTDEEAATRAKLSAPLPPSEEEEQPLPFSTAPVSPTGGSSPICSQTAERPRPPEASASCRCSSTDDVMRSAADEGGV